MQVSPVQATSQTSLCPEPCTYQFFALYGVAAVYYWVVCLVLSFGQTRLEERQNRYVAK
jgi:cystine transport system permease protein